MNAKQAHEIALVVDELENALYGTRLKLNPELHISGLKHACRTSRDKLAKLVRETTGEDPWKHDPLDG